MMMRELIRERIREARDTIALIDSHASIFSSLALAAELCIACLNNGGKIMLCGNGGSAAQAQHTAAELIGRFTKYKRPPFSAIALTTDTAVLTALGNDFSFEDIYARQVEGVGNACDVLIGITTSGKSENVLRALRVARASQMRAIAFTGPYYDPCEQICHAVIHVPALKRDDDTARVQEAHLVQLHILCELIERYIHEGTFNACE